MDYQIVRYSPEYSEQVAELQTRLWDSDVAVNRAYFEWKYLRNPYIASPLAHVVLRDGRVIGMRGMFGAQWEAGPSSEVFTVPCAGDFIVLPEHRSAALAMRIITAAADDLATLSYEYVFNLTGGAATQLASSLSGWRGIGPIETATRRTLPARPTRALHGALRRGVGQWPWLARRVAGAREAMRTAWRTRSDGEPFATLDRRYVASTASSAGGVSLESQPRPNAMASLVRQLGHDGRIRHVRDARYLAWRYTSPRSCYRFLYSGTPALAGYLVLWAPARDWGGRAEIVDWEATTEDVRRNLLAAAVEWGRFARLSIWCSTLSPESIAMLRAEGFSLSGPAPAGRPLASARPTVLVRRVRHHALPPAEWALGGRPLLDIGSWDLRMIYRDL